VYVRRTVQRRAATSSAKWRFQAAAKLHLLRRRHWLCENHRERMPPEGNVPSQPARLVSGKAIHCRSTPGFVISSIDYGALSLRIRRREEGLETGVESIH
jgi:hypothetical protein